MKVKIIIFIMSFFLVSNCIFAEDSIYLKSGTKIDGWILDITDTHVKIEAAGIPLVYSLDTVDGIDVRESSPYVNKLNNRERQFSSAHEVAMWLTYYYLNTDSKRLLPAIEVLLKDRANWESAQRANPIIHFFATALREDKYELDKFRTLLDKSDYFQSAILKRIIYEAENPRDIKPIGVEAFDLLWAEFLATGKPEPVLKLINSLNWKVADDDPYKYADLAVLVWSLSANARQHSRVKHICEEELKKRWGISRKRLYEALNTSPGEIRAKYAVETAIRADRYRNKRKCKDIFGRIKEFLTNIRNREKFDE